MRKFGCILMNPPYGKRSDTALDKKICAEALRHAEPGGEMVSLMPAGWIAYPAGEYQRGSAWLKFKDSLGRHLDSVETYTPSEAKAFMGCKLHVDLGVHKFRAGQGRFDRRDFIDKSFGLPAHSIIGKCLKFPRLKQHARKLKDVCRERFSFCLAKILDCAHSHGKPYALGLLRSRRYGVFTGGLNRDGFTPEQMADCVIRINCGTVANWPAFAFEDPAEAWNFHDACWTDAFLALNALCMADKHISLDLPPWLGETANPETGLTGFKGAWTSHQVCQALGLTAEEEAGIERLASAVKSAYNLP